MTGERGASGAPKDHSGQSGSEQIEYLLYQSTQGFHFVFDHSEVAKVLSRDQDGEIATVNLKDMDKVQSLLSSFLDRPTLSEKRSYLDSLSRADYELLVKAYFQLVDKTILAHSNLRH